MIKQLKERLKDGKIDCETYESIKTISAGNSKNCEER